ncbi:MAG: glycosyltransferase [Liquorilactobacillus hordei]|uniref:glycosyltransferase n=1 Tax=Liquorilactobacillus hordei TaxID=468911 RepID=UPI0039EAD264
MKEDNNKVFRMVNKKTKYKLTISLLVSNSIGTIQKCLESLTPILQQVDSELIVVDTVGEKNSDGSLEIAKKYTDKIVHFAWCDDFAAARNAGLTLAQGEWFMFIDDDEWFNDVNELVDFFNNDECDNYLSLTYDIHNYKNLSTLSYYRSVATRCVKLTPNTKFVNKIHEQLVPIFTPSKKTKIFAHHYGYITEKNDKKVKRNEEIIERVLKENPQDMHMWTQLLGGLDKTNEDDIKKVKEIVNKALHEFEKKQLKVNEDYFNVGIIFDFLFLCLTKEKKWIEVLKLRENIETAGSFSEYERCISDFFVYQALVNLNRFEDARNYVQDYSKKLKGLRDDEQKWLQQQSFYFESYVSEDKLFTMATTIAQYDRMNKNWRAIVLDAYNLPLENNSKYLANILPVIFEAAYYEKDNKLFQYVCRELMDEDGKLPKVFGIGILNVKKALGVNPIELTKIISVINAPKDPFIMVQAALAGEQSSSFNKQIEKLKKQKVIIVTPCEELFPLLIRNGIEPTKFIETINYDEWVTTINQLAEFYAEEKDKIPSFLAKIEKTWQPCLKRSMLLMCLRHKYLFSQDITTDMIKGQIESYIADVVSFGNAVYNVDLLSQDSYLLLPGEVRFGLFLKEAIEEKKNGHTDRYFAKLHQALNSYEIANHLVELLLKEYSDEQVKQQNMVNELEQLGNQVKMKIIELIQQEKFEQAKPLVLELAELLPKDLEVKRLWSLCNKG